MRLFGIARVEPARRQQPDARVGAAALRGQPGAEGGEEGGVALDIQAVLQAPKVRLTASRFSSA